jgi:hypothetical protein
MSSDHERFYARGTLSIEQIYAEITRFWLDCEKPGDAALDAELRAAGFDRRMLGEADFRRAITVQATASGADPTSVLIIVTFAPAANRIVKDLWETVILPRIRRRWGEDAVGAEKEGQD